MGSCASKIDPVEILQRKLAEANKVECALTEKLASFEENNMALKKQVTLLRKEIKSRDIELNELLNDHDHIKETLDDLKHVLNN